MAQRFFSAFLFLALCGLSPQIQAFCGFYVAKADSKLFNKASQVALARHEDKTVLTMANDYQGNPQEFAIVIPVPTVLKQEQIHVADKGLLDHLDAYTSPRLVEYFDPDPCYQPPRNYRRIMPAPMAESGSGGGRRSGARSLGVTIEAQYTVGEYDILILSAKQSEGLEIWLKENGYRIPEGASSILGSYIKQNLKFFVAKVNLKEQAKLGFTYLRPIQVAYESPKFMLPIRLGTVNAEGPQELFIYTLTRKGRVETTNYRTVKLPTGLDLPVHVKGEFANFYKAMFSEQVKKEDMRVVFTEYAWDMNWCDPCAADPLSDDELRKLGVFWLDQESQPAGGNIKRPLLPPGRIPSRQPAAKEVFVTRLHVRYDAKRFPEDLVFQETGDRENFQARYVLRHPWTENNYCAAAVEYRRGLPARFDQEAQNLARLTGWPIGEIRKKINFRLPASPPANSPWYRRIWK